MMDGVTGEKRQSIDARRYIGLGAVLVIAIALVGGVKADEGESQDPPEIRGVSNETLGAVGVNLGPPIEVAGAIGFDEAAKQAQSHFPGRVIDGALVQLDKLTFHGPAWAFNIDPGYPAHPIGMKPGQTASRQFLVVFIDAMTGEFISAGELMEVVD